MSATRAHTAARIEGALHSLLSSLSKEPPLFVALSGGLDSILLLHLAAQWAKSHGRTFQAIHVHHGLSPNADVWQAHCEATCQRLGVPLHVHRVTLSVGREGIEAAARKERYQVFESHLSKNGVILLAHHQDDQLETVLMRVLKGTDLMTLGGMPKSRILGNGEVIRPFLAFPRVELEVLARDRALEWVEDESNQDCRFERNRVRHRLFPMLDQLAQDWRAQCLSLMEQIQTLQKAQLALANRMLVEVGQSDSAHFEYIALDVFTGLSEFAAVQLLRAWVQNRGYPQPSEKIIKRFYSEVVLSRKSAKPELRWGAVWLRRDAARIYLGTALQSVSQQMLPIVLSQSQLEQGLTYVLEDASASLTISLRPAKEGPGSLKVLASRQYRLGLDELGVESLELDFPEVGERFSHSSGHNRALQSYWRDRSFPWWLKRQMPVLRLGGNIIWAGPEERSERAVSKGVERVLYLTWCVHR